MNKGGSTRRARHLSRVAVALMLGGAAMPAGADSAAAADAQPVPDPASQEIVVNAPPLFRDLNPERDLDQDAIDSYGVSTIDELLGEIQVELGEEAEQPLIFVNGKRINSLDEIGALPVEALRNLQVLPRGSAVRVGGNSGQRVVNITLKREVRTVTVTAANKIATDGDWNAQRGELLLTRVRGQTRANLAFRVRDESDLLESDRGILQPPPSRPYALGGNVVGYPNSSGEIDPLLSAAAGEIVTVVPVPSGTTGTLADFVANANRAAVTDIGRYRTLRPQTRNYDFNGSFATPLTPWLTSSATIRLSRNESNSLRGLPSALFRLSADNPFSPFSRDVGLAEYGARPLGYRSVRNSGEANLTLDATIGSWTGNFNAKHSVAKDSSKSERQGSFGFVPVPDGIDPFGTGLSSLIAVRHDRTTTRSVTSEADLTLNGPAAQLPAGPVNATVEGDLAWNRLSSTSTFGEPADRDTRRNAQSIRGAIDVPLTSRDGFMAPLGDLSADAEYGRIHYSDAGTLTHSAFGLTWEPVAALRLRGSIERTGSPAPVEILGGPVIITPDARTFDPLTGQTVDVVQIFGGNAALLPEIDKTRRVTALLRLVPRYNLQLNAEYTDTDRRNFVSSLPDASAAVMLAFPDRFIRDGNGVLTTVDQRPVNFQGDHEKRLRWGFSMNAKLAGGTVRPAGGSGAKRGPPSPTTYLQLTANHTMVFSDEILIRPGLAPVDLLGGGAIGIGGGRLRHQVDGTAAITSGGIGARLGITWRGSSRLQSRLAGGADTLQFSPLLAINLRAFADLKRFLPHSKWAKGFRLSLDVVNATNNRQRVHDSLGHTPLQYQPAYRDPLGRTIEIELRKVF